MTDREILEQILSNQQNTNKRLDNLENEISSMKNEISDMKSEIADMKNKIDKLENEMSGMKAEISHINFKLDNVDNEITGIKSEIHKLNLHIENGTDKNIQLIAENFVELTKKLNQAIPIADKNLAYEIKVNYVIEEVNKLKEDFEKFKKQTA